MTVQECLDDVQVFLQVDCEKSELLDEVGLSLEEASQVLGGGEQVAVICPHQAEQEWCESQ